MIIEVEYARLFPEEEGKLKAHRTVDIISGVTHVEFDDTASLLWFYGKTEGFVFTDNVLSIRLSEAGIDKPIKYIQASDISKLLPYEMNKKTLKKMHKKVSDGKIRYVNYTLTS